MNFFVNLAPISAWVSKRLSSVYSKYLPVQISNPFVHITSKEHKLHHDKLVILIPKCLFIEQISSYFHRSQSYQWLTVTQIYYFCLYLIKNKILEPNTFYSLCIPYHDLATGFKAQAYVNYRTPLNYHTVK